MPQGAEDRRRGNRSSKDAAGRLHPTRARMLAPRARGCRLPACAGIRVRASYCSVWKRGVISISTPAARRGVKSAAGVS